MNHNPNQTYDLPTTVAALLAQADVQLAVAEFGADGAVAAALVAAGLAERITSSRAFGDRPALAAALHVSEAKMAAFGTVSAMVAAEAAAALIDTYEGGWGLAVLCGCGNQDVAHGVTNPTHVDTGCFVALGAPGSTEVRPCAEGEVVPTAFALLKAAAEARIATRREF
jgi:nicotinamide mononucleotide (NMN) deamidase PncC